MENTDSSFFKFPPLIEAKIHQRKDPNYIMGTAILTIVIGSMVFLTALSINDVAQLYFERKPCQDGEVKKAAKYALVVVLTAILLIYFSLSWIPGTKL